MTTVVGPVRFVELTGKAGRGRTGCLKCKGKPSTRRVTVGGGQEVAIRLVVSGVPVELPFQVGIEADFDYCPRCKSFYVPDPPYGVAGHTENEPAQAAV